MAASRRALLVAVVGLLLGALIGSTLWGVAERNRDDALAATSRATPEEQIVKTGVKNIPIVSAWIKAFQNRDYTQARALFTKDGVLTTIDNVHSSIYRNTKPEPGQRVDGAEFQRLIKGHFGDTLKIVGTPIQVGNTAVWGFKFTYAGGVTSARGTVMFHLRNGKIVLGVIDPASLTGGG